MFLELIATIIAGVGAAGVVLAANRLTGRRLPRWLMPIGAALAMILMTIWSEYTWYDRTVATLPAGLDVAEVNEARQMMRPWTFAVPLKDRFLAIDTQRMKTNPALPGQHIAEVYALGRWQPVRQFPVLIDCDGSRRAALGSDTEFGPDGSVGDAAWTEVPASDPLLATACTRS